MIDEIIPMVSLATTSHQHPRRKSWATETGEDEKQRNRRKTRINERLRRPRNQGTNALRPGRRRQLL